MTLHQRLALDRPLCFFDLESTGTFPDRDRIVDLTIITLHPDGSRSEFSALVNPTVPIPPSATAIHGISDAMVGDQPTFKQLAPPIAALLTGADLAGFGVRRFDLRMLAAEFARAAVPFSLEGRRIIDALAIYHKREPRDLSAALRFYCGDELEGAHRALADVEATIAVLAGQFARYTDLPTSIDALHAYCRDERWVDDTGRIVWIDGVACIGFGKHAGRTLESLAAEPYGRDYLRWILDADFPTDTKRIVSSALAGKFPTPPAAEEASHAAVG